MVTYSKHAYEETLAPNLYYDRVFDIDAAKILPGEYYITQRDMLLVTVLGSCVAACIRDKKNGIGGMNHFMLPEDNSRTSKMAGNSTRYGVYAMEVLINQLLKIGARRENLEAKLFGGGAVLKQITKANVGEKNSKFALDYLRTEGIPVIADDLLDIYPRKVYFFPNSGKVLVKKLKNIHNETIVKREVEYVSRLGSTKVEGDIELFT